MPKGFIVEACENNPWLKEKLIDLITDGVRFTGRSSQGGNVRYTDKKKEMTMLSPREQKLVDDMNAHFDEQIKLATKAIMAGGMFKIFDKEIWLKDVYSNDLDSMQHIIASLINGDIDKNEIEDGIVEFLESEKAQFLDDNQYD